MSAAPDLSPAAGTLLLAWAFLHHGGLTRDPEPGEIETARRFLGRPGLDPRTAGKELVDQGLAVAAGSPALRLTPDGARRAGELYRAWSPLRFEELLAASATLPAYARHLATTHPGAPAASFGLLDAVGVRALEDALAPGAGERILELGSGNGGLALRWARRDVQVTAVDRAAGATARLERWSKALEGPGSVRPVALDLDRPEAVATLQEAGPWDGVVAVDAFDHLERLGEILHLAAGRLRPGGRVVLVASEAVGAERLGGLLGRLPGPARIDRVDLTAVEARFWRRQLAGLDRWDGSGSRAEDDLRTVLTLEAEGGHARVLQNGTRRTLWRYAPVP